MLKSIQDKISSFINNNITKIENFDLSIKNIKKLLKENNKNYNKSNLKNIFNFLKNLENLKSYFTENKKEIKNWTKLENLKNIKENKKKNYIYLIQSKNNEIKLKNQFEFYIGLSNQYKIQRIKQHLFENLNFRKKQNFKIFTLSKEKINIIFENITEFKTKTIEEKLKILESNLINYHYNKNKEILLNNRITKIKQQIEINKDLQNIDKLFKKSLNLEIFLENNNNNNNYIYFIFKTSNKIIKNSIYLGFSTKIKQRLNKHFKYSNFFNKTEIENTKELFNSFYLEISKDFCFKLKKSNFYFWEFLLFKFFSLNNNFNKNILNKDFILTKEKQKTLKNYILENKTEIKELLNSKELKKPNKEKIKIFLDLYKITKNYTLISKFFNFNRTIITKLINSNKPIKTFKKENFEKYEIIENKIKNLLKNKDFNNEIQNLKEKTEKNLTENQKNEFKENIIFQTIWTIRKNEVLRNNKIKNKTKNLILTLNKKNFSNYEIVNFFNLRLNTIIKLIKSNQPIKTFKKQNKKKYKTIENEIKILLKNKDFNNEIQNLKEKTEKILTENQKNEFKENKIFQTIWTIRKNIFYNNKLFLKSINKLKQKNKKLNDYNLIVFFNINLRNYQLRKKIKIYVKN